MHITLTVDSYYEYFLTILAWIINNQAWKLIIESGSFALPILLQLLGFFKKARDQGEDEGNKGQLLLNWLENSIYLSLFLLFLTCVPIFTVSYNTLEFDTEREKSCGRPVIAPKDTGLSPLISELNGKQAQLPLWWAFTYTLGKGITHGMISAIPCKPDLRQLRFEVQSTQIESPTLRQEIQDFVGQCFVPARNKIKQEAQMMSNVTARDIDWIGSQTLLNNGYYARFRSQLPRPLWQYDPNRDSGLPNTGNGGYPNCVNWWADTDIGLKDRILSIVDPNIWTKFQSVIKSQPEYEEAILRSLVRPENLNVSEGSVYRGYANNIKLAEQGDFFYTLNKGMGVAGAGITAFFSTSAFDAMKASLPMIQGIISMAIIIFTPFIIVIGSYGIKPIITITISQFGIFFLSFWWELARWLDTWMFEALYNSNTHSRWNMAGLMNSVDDWLLNIVMGTMFIFLPALWIGSLGWAGVRAGESISSSIKNSGNKTQAAGQKGADMAENRVTK